ncbi:hypothetical protein EJ06DRAFT_420818 [Trichodelitschia bisporula]|uniref:Fungal N-terminal domain-containing protein n=1 Tax=Trichodelitschia bisporula TaxID=703511 RepID=A0A6G1HWA1_9PEZI|nr:hypothetical protein EJ06DRAFT_420818 [Trichodelitschia bisporula]
MEALAVNWLLVNINQVINVSKLALETYATSTSKEHARLVKDIDSAILSWQKIAQTGNLNSAAASDDERSVWTIVAKTEAIAKDISAFLPLAKRNTFAAGITNVWYWTKEASLLKRLQVCENGLMKRLNALDRRNKQRIFDDKVTRRRNLRRPPFF